MPWRDELDPQIACRCEAPLDRATTSKISMFCHVGQDQVLGVHDVASVYHVPLLLREQGIIKFLQKRLALDQIVPSPDRLTAGADIAKRWRELTIRYARHELLALTKSGKATIACSTKSTSS
jgi:CTP synthase